MDRRINPVVLLMLAMIALATSSVSFAVPGNPFPVPASRLVTGTPQSLSAALTGALPYYSRARNGASGAG